MAELVPVVINAAGDEHEKLGIGTDFLDKGSIPLASLAGNLLKLGTDGLEVDPADVEALTAVVIDGPSGLAGNGTTATPLAVAPQVAGTPPVATTGTDVPTNIYGARTALMGEPRRWVTLGEGANQVVVGDYSPAP